MAARVGYVVIMVKENHIFDNYFGTFQGANGAEFDQAPNPPYYPDQRHQAWMNRDGLAKQVQYKEADIPDYFDLAPASHSATTIFSEVAGPSTPNHLMLICADAPIINNPAIVIGPVPVRGMTCVHYLSHLSAPA
jgi:phospholipase C